MSRSWRQAGLLAGALIIIGTGLIPHESHGQILRTRTTTLAMAIQPPQGVAVAQVATGVQISWQAVSGAVEYVISRGPDATSPTTPIASVAGSELTYIDAGFNSQAGYQVTAVGSSRQQAASVIVLYTPPATLTMPSGTRTAISSGIRSPSGMTMLVPPVIGPFPGHGSPDAYADTGGTITVSGSGFAGLTSAVLVDAYKPYSTWQVNPGGSSHPVTPVGLTASGFSFAARVPAYSMSRYTPYLLIVTTNGGADTSTGAIHVKLPEPVRKITSASPTMVRAGLRINVEGVGLEEVTGAYFGVGTPGSTTNPLIAIANRHANGLQILVPAGCKQSGLLMLHQPVASGTPRLITPDAPTTVHCFSDTPAGTIDGLDASGIFYASPTSTISIRGTNLRAVTHAVDQMSRKYPVTYTTNGTVEWVTFKIGANFSPGGGLGFTLENVLTDPVMNGTVTGTVLMLAAPTWYRLYPVWAEAGMRVTINGHNLSNGATPQVTVGGVPAQVLVHDQLKIEFRMPSAASGPIAVTNPGGTVQLSGPFTSGTGLQHPGFIVVNGPSTITSIEDRTDTLVLRGQNLPRVQGICIRLKPNPGAPSGADYQFLRRDYDTRNEAVTSTEMRVPVTQARWLIEPSAIRLWAPTTPPGDHAPPPSAYACQANPGGVQWP
jgi:hypothetical protein